MTRRADLVRSTQTGGELPPSNHEPPPGPERPGLGPIRSGSAESEATASADKMFDFHPSSQTIPSIPAGTVSNLHFGSNWDTDASPAEATCYWEPGRLREEKTGENHYSTTTKGLKKKKKKKKSDPSREADPSRNCYLAHGQDHDSARRRFTENDETDSTPELPAGRILSGGWEPPPVAAHKLEC